MHVFFFIVPTNGLAWSLYNCAVLWAVGGSSANERPLGTIHEEKGNSSRLPISISSGYDLSCCKRRKDIPFFLIVGWENFVFFISLKKLYNIIPWI